MSNAAVLGWISWRVYHLEDFVKVTAVDNRKLPTFDFDPVENKSTYLECYSVYFDPSRDPRRKLIRAVFFMELLAGIAIGIIDGIRPDSDSCLPICIAMMIVCLALAIYLVGYRPYRTRLDTIFSCTGALMMLLIACLSIALVVNPDDDVAAEFLGITALALNVVFFLQALIAPSWAMYLKYRRWKAAKVEKGAKLLEGEGDDFPELVPGKNQGGRGAIAEALHRTNLKKAEDAKRKGQLKSEDEDDSQYLGVPLLSSSPPTRKKRNKKAWYDRNPGDASDEDTEQDNVDGLDFPELGPGDELPKPGEPIRPDPSSPEARRKMTSSWLSPSRSVDSSGSPQILVTDPFAGITSQNDNPNPLVVHDDPMKHVAPTGGWKRRAPPMSTLERLKREIDSKEAAAEDTFRRSLEVADSPAFADQVATQKIYFGGKVRSAPLWASPTAGSSGTFSREIPPIVPPSFSGVSPAGSVSGQSYDDDDL